MPNLITIEKSVLDDIFGQLAFLKRKVLSLEKIKTQTVKKTEPRYGSEEWWEKSTKKALADIRAGRVKSFDTVEELISDLNS